MPKKEEKLTNDKTEKLTKEQEKTQEFIELSYVSVTKLFEESDPVHPADKAYFIARAIAHNMPNEVSIMWAMDAIIEAFDREIETWNTSKADARTSVLEKLNVFKNKFEDSTTFDDNKVVSVN